MGVIRGLLWIRQWTFKVHKMLGNSWVAEQVLACQETRFHGTRGKIFVFCTSPRPALGPTQPPVQWVPGALSSRVNLPGREADHSPPTSAEVKNTWIYTSTPSRVFMAWRLISWAQGQLLLSYCNYACTYLYIRRSVSVYRNTSLYEMEIVEKGKLFRSPGIPSQTPFAVLRESVRSMLMSLL
jgi:hypothetical protein